MKTVLFCVAAVIASSSAYGQPNRMLDTSKTAGAISAKRALNAEG